MNEDTLDLTVTERPPIGDHYARFIDFTTREEPGVEEGEKPTTFKELVAELVAPTMSDGSRFAVSRRYRWDTRGINTFKEDLKTWRGKALTPAELKAFNPSKEFAGKGAKIRVVHVAESGTKVARFVKFEPAPEHDLPQANPTEVTTQTK